MSVQTNARLEAITGFLDFLGDALGVYAFQTFDDDKERNDKARAKTHVGTFDECRRYLVEANRDRFAVHVTINDTAGKRRVGKNVVRVRKHFVEIDGDHTLEEIQDIARKNMLDVAWINESSPGKYHVYFNVAEDVAADLDGFTYRQKQLAKLFDGGRESVDPARVLRLPGFYHQKKKPFMVRAVYKSATAHAHTLQDFDIALGDVHIETPTQPTDTAEHEEDQTAIDRAIDHFKSFPEAISNTPNGKMDKKGNSQTFDACCFARDFGIDESTCLDLALKYYNPRCKPIWSFEELQRLVENAYKYARGKQGAKHPDVEVAQDFGGDPITEEEAEAIPAEPKSRLEVIDLENVQEQNIDYVWQNRLAVGKHTALAGVGGKGKSQVLYYTAARISKGENWPFGEGKAPKGSVLILSAEDDVADMMKPRLIAAGADVKLVKPIKAVVEGSGHKKRFNLLADLDALYRLCRERGDVVAVGIDPLGSYLGGDLDTHRDAALRSALDPISEMASAAKVAFLSVMHFNKAGSMKSAMDRVMGGAGFVNAPRCALGWLVDPDDEDKRLLLRLKTNMGDPQGLRGHLALTDTTKDQRTGLMIRAPHVVWDGPTEITADAVVAQANEREAPKLDEAIDFLKAELKDGPRPVTEVKAHAVALNITADTLKRARYQLGIVARQIEGVKHGGWEYHYADPEPGDFDE